MILQMPFDSSEAYLLNQRLSTTITPQWKPVVKWHRHSTHTKHIRVVLLCRDSCSIVCRISPPLSCGTGLLSRRKLPNMDCEILSLLPQFQLCQQARSWVSMSALSCTQGKFHSSIHSCGLMLASATSTHVVSLLASFRWYAYGFCANLLTSSCGMMTQRTG